MQNSRLFCLITFLLISVSATAADGWIIGSRSETVTTGQAIALDVVKPDDVAVWPDKLQLKVSASGISEEITMTSSDTGRSRRLYTGTPKAEYVGIIRAELQGFPSNRVMMLAARADNAEPMQVVSPAATATATATATEESSASAHPAEQPKLVIASPGEEPALSANEPIYFLMGDSDKRGIDARFQISFKYRMFDPQGAVGSYAPWLSNLYFAYTQTTLWDVGEKSSPFRDTAYRPSLFYQWGGKGIGLHPDSWRLGVEHESNGQGGQDSRSINIAYLRPAWHIDLTNGRTLSFLPKIYDYLNKEDENDDIQRYRGYVDWQLRYGREDGLLLTGLYRKGTGGYASGQVDASYPISNKIFNGTGAFVHVQLFSGYGETLLDYNRDSNTQLRVGFSLAR